MGVRLWTSPDSSRCRWLCKKCGHSENPSVSGGVQDTLKPSTTGPKYLCERNGNTRSSADACGAFTALPRGSKSGRSCDVRRRACGESTQVQALSCGPTAGAAQQAPQRHVGLHSQAFGTGQTGLWWKHSGQPWPQGGEAPGRRVTWPEAAFWEDGCSLS